MKIRIIMFELRREGDPVDTFAGVYSDSHKIFINEDYNTEEHPELLPNGKTPYIIRFGSRLFVEQPYFGKDADKTPRAYFEIHPNLIATVTEL